jgi:hypothetical protein
MDNEARSGGRSIMSETEHDKRGATVELAGKAQKIADNITKWKSASTEARKELVENLKEAIRLLQRYLVSSLMAAGAFAALAWAPIDVVQVEMQLPVPISRGAALLLLGAVYFVTGLLASLTLARAKRLCLLLGQSTDPLLTEAVLMYPSIPTINVPGPRVGLSLLPPVFVVAGIVKIFGNQLFALWPIVGVLMLCVSPFQIAYKLRHALSEEFPDFDED